MEKVLVSGGAGFIGSHTVDLLLNKTSKVRHLAARDDDIRHSQANIMRMNQQLGVRAQTDILEGLDELLSHSGDQGYITRGFAVYRSAPQWRHFPRLNPSNLENYRMSAALTPETTLYYGKSRLRYIHYLHS